jgi:hypothetical protein
MTFDQIGKYKGKIKLHKSKLGNFEGLPIRPIISKKRFVIDNEYTEKGYAAIFPNTVTLVYLVLAKYANYTTQVCFPSLNTIMREMGSKNRNTVMLALKTLESHCLIYIQHSKGWSSNQYVLLKSSVWKEPTCNTGDTVLKQENSLPSVSNPDGEQYQNKPNNSIADDTGIHRIELSNEIIGEENTIFKEKPRTKIRPHDMPTLRHHFLDKDILKAEEIIVGQGLEPKYSIIKEFLNHQASKGEITPVNYMPS